MSPKINESLFKNAAYTRAFLAQMDEPSQAVSCDGITWTIGEKKFQINESKMNPVRAFFATVWHKISLSCSHTYQKRFYKASQKFERALSRFNKAKDKTERIYQKAMVVQAKAKLDFENASKAIFELESVAGELNAKWNEADEARQNTPPKKAEEDPIFIELKAKIESLEELKPYIPEYVNDRVPKEGLQAVADFFERAFDRVMGREADVHPQLKEFAEAYFNPIPLNPENPHDCKPFDTFIEEEIKKMEKASFERIEELNIPDNKIKLIEDEIKIIQDALLDWTEKQAVAAKEMQPNKRL